MVRGVSVSALSKSPSADVAKERGLSVTKTTSGVVARNRRATTPVRIVVSLTGAFLTWEAFRVIGVLNPLYFPGVTEVFNAFVTAIGEGTSGTLLVATIDSLKTWLLSFSIAAALGLVTGVLIGSSAVAAAFLAPLFRFARSTPAVALIPVAILLVGIGTTAKVMIVVFAGIWPIVLNTSSGIRSIPTQYRDTAKTVRIHGILMLRQVIIPAITPAMVTGFRVSMSMTLAVTIGVDLLIGNSGLGAAIGTYRAVGNTASAYAGVVLAGLMGLTLLVGLTALERRILFWSPEFRTRS